MDGELRAGDWVEVKSLGEILSTLDDRGRLQALPFMPEMVKSCGRRFRVASRADKVCDTIERSGSRRLPGTVFLEGLRCDGAAHGGCQAECLLFWKDAWLRRVEDGQTAAPPATPPAPAEVERLTRETEVEIEQDGKKERVFRCQATEMTAASVHLRTWDPRPYLREVRSGNVGLRRFLRVMPRAMVTEVLHKLGLRPNGPVRGTREASSPPEPRLGLVPGEWVRVKSEEEIARTLNAEGLHKGLWFDWEMVPFCGKVFRVRKRVTRLIHEPTGRMLEMKSDCVVLEDTICSGDHSRARWFCPRAILPYWRECWLERAPEVTEQARSAG